MKHLLSTAVMLTLWTATLASGAHTKTMNLGKGHTPSIGSDGQGHLFVVFEGLDSRSGAADIFYSSSNDRGRTWTQRLDVSPTTGVSTGPKVAIEKSGAIDVVWSDTASGENSPDIFFTRSVAGGHTWTKPADIANTAGISREPVLAVGPDNTIHVAFSDNGKGDKKDVFYTSSNDGGKTWSKDRPLENVSNTPGDSSQPDIAVGADGVVHIAWKDDSAADQRPQIYYTRRAEGIWSSPANISKSERYSFRPDIACASTGKIYITWSDRSNWQDAADIWCISSTNNGPFTHPAHVADSGSIASEAIITAGRTDRAAIAWPNRPLGLRHPKIYWRVLSNDLSQSPRAMHLSESSGIQMAPDLAIDGNQLIVVWEERKDANTLVRVRSIDLAMLTSKRANTAEHRANKTSP